MQAPRSYKTGELIWSSWDFKVQSEDPKAVKEKVSAAEAEEIKGKLEAAGATVTIK